MGHIEVNDVNFEKEVLEKSKEYYVLVDFWAPWCMPCLILGPTLEKVTAEFKNLVFAKLNVDENYATASRYRIMSIPAVKLFKNGEIVDEFIGSLPEQSVREFLKRHIK